MTAGEASATTCRRALARVKCQRARTWTRIWTWEGEAGQLLRDGACRSVSDPVD